MSQWIEMHHNVLWQIMLKKHCEHDALHCNGASKCIATRHISMYHIWMHQFCSTLKCIKETKSDQVKTWDLVQFLFNLVQSRQTALVNSKTWLDVQMTWCSLSWLKIILTWTEVVSHFFWPKSVKTWSGQVLTQSDAVFLHFSGSNIDHAGSNLNSLDCTECVSCQHNAVCM